MSYRIKLDIYAIHGKASFQRNQERAVLSRLDQPFWETAKAIFNTIDVHNDEKKSILRSVPTEHVRIRERTKLITGVLEGGKYGLKQNLVDVRDRTRAAKKKNEHEAVTNPYYFAIHCPDDNERAFLILQRYGNLGIKGDFWEHIKKEIKDQYPKLTWRCDPVMDKEKARKLLMESQVKAVQLLSRGIQGDQFARNGVRGGIDDGIEVQVIIKSKRGKELNLEHIDRFLSNQGDLIEIRGFNRLGLTKRNTQANLFVDDVHGPRKINSDDLEKLKSVHDIHDELRFDDSGTIPQKTSILPIMAKIATKYGQS